MNHPLLSLPLLIDQAPASTGITGVATSAEPTPDWLRRSAEVITQSCLQVLEWLGVTSGDIPLGRLGLGLIAFLALAPLMLALGWLLSRMLRTRAARPGARSAIAALLSSLSRPAAMLVWIYGVFVALAPLLVLSVDQNRDQALFSAVRFVVLVLTCTAIIWFLLRFMSRLEEGATEWTTRSENTVDDILVPLAFRSVRYIVPMLGVALFLEIAPLPPSFEGALRLLTSIFIIGAVSWVVTQVILALDDLLLLRYRLDSTNNLQARTIYTQVRVIQRIALVIVAIITLASVLLLIPQVRQIGATLLASAGVASIIIGFGLQRAVANIVAGVQIALTQPIRIDDVVIVEGEWGRIEEITLTYVVVKIWDLRRLVVPISHFIEKPFQNWTRTSAEILGTIFLHVDYTVPVEELRRAFKELVSEHPLWDGNVFGVQVTGCSERTVELRVLVSAADASKAWDLRCDLRERMLAFVQTHYPDSLPRIRISEDSPDDNPSTEAPVGHTVTP